MHCWGITGPVGAGKSLVGEVMAERGVLNLEVDAVGHDLLGLSPIRKGLLGLFGPSIFQPDGTVDRRELGRRAFATAETLASLNALMHPPMIAEVERRLAQARRAGRPAVVINAALLFAMGLDRLTERIIFVRAAESIRHRRLVECRGWSPERARNRIWAGQDEEPPPAVEVTLFDNDGDPAHIKAWVDSLLAAWAPEIGPAVGSPLPLIDKTRSRA
jgi:dephospho-CoA kinase